MTYHNAVFAGMFIWQWVPGFFYSTLGSISVLCLVTSNRTARFYGSAGPNAGPGILSFTLDWSLIAPFLPIATPFWATCCWLVNRIAWSWIVVPICYTLNCWGGPIIQSTYYWPDGAAFGVINSNKIFNRTGHTVHIRRVDPDKPDALMDFNSILAPDFTLDLTKYHTNVTLITIDMTCTSPSTSAQPLQSVTFHNS